MDCPSCHAIAPERSKFCIECGEPLPGGCRVCGHQAPAPAKFCPECGASLTGDIAKQRTGVDGAAHREPPTVAVTPAERGQLTVMFCDLVGSTALATRLDPEDLREIMSAYHRCVAETVTRFDGYIARTMGDGIMVYFGYPQAHEDDVERAVQAGLALVEAVTGLEGDRLQIRVGLDTGLVVVGDLVEAGEASERGVVGETPNRAARLQTVAEPNTVVIGPGARPLLGDLFRYAELGSLELKGFVAPIKAYRVLGLSTIESRFEAFHPVALAPLVGREEEIELLGRRWQRAKTSAGQVVLISGEPGIGKSRLTSAILEQIATGPHILLRYFCSPHHTHSALYPLIRELERAAGFARNDDAQSKLAKLAGLLSHESLSSEDTQLLAELLSVPDTGHRPELSLSPEQRKRKTLQALIRRIEALSGEQPVLVLLEDVHWIDPTSLEALDHLVERARRLPVLILMTFRPEFSPPWAGQPHVTLTMLSRLDQTNGAALIHQIAGNQRLPPEAVGEILNRTDGVPLFVEELTKAVVEARASASGAATLGLGVAIPATLDALLMARLDGLGAAAKETAQIGAAIGREFSYELLAAVSHGTDADLLAALGQLVGAGLVFARGVPPEATYLFKHALVQDASYGTRLHSRRREVHRRIVAVLEARYPAMVEQQPELLAHHCTQARLVEKAIAYWEQAGRKSLARSANTEAAVQLRKGLHEVSSLPASRQRWQQELGLQSTLGAALVASLGSAAPETGQSYARARELCEELGETKALIPVLSGLGTYHQTRAEYPLMREVAQKLLDRGEEQRDTASSLVGHRSMGICLHQLGEFAAAGEHFERVLRLYSAERHRALASIAAYDMRAVALSYLGWDLFILGQPDQARDLEDQALIWSRRLQHPHTIAFVLVYAALLNLLRCNHHNAEERLRELSLFATDHRFPVWLALADVMQGYVLAARGEAAEGLTLARKGWAAATATGLRWNRTFYLALLAATCERAGQTDEAFELLGAGLEAVEETGERWFEAELQRHRGEWLVKHGEDSEAEACFRCALAVARRQHARLWELQAASSLARFLYDGGRGDEAGDLLTPVLANFAEGVQIPALHEARALLGRVRPRKSAIA